MLPIIAHIPQIIANLSEHNKLVLQAEPGAGKSTALPLSLLKETSLKDSFVKDSSLKDSLLKDSQFTRKKIIMLEPRRIAAKSIAFYLAKQLKERVGDTVGYHVKNDRKISARTVLEIVTEGILTRRLQHDPELEDVGLIIFDEFHERSIHSDMALMLALDVQETIREDLKLLVMSATMNTQLISRYLGQAPVIECSGRAYPVDVHYLPNNTAYQKNALTLSVMKAIQFAFAHQSEGDVLIFLPGQADIKKCLSEATKSFHGQDNVIFLPLYGSLSIEQQTRALTLDPTGKRRIIFTTNIAETSLTINGIQCVIDSGLEKVSRYDPVNGMSRLETIQISKASAEQRKGRAGRLSKGICIRLWHESKQQLLNDFHGEEISRTDLSNCVLELSAWGLTKYEDIHWLTAPPLAHFDSAKQLLSVLGLIDGGLTPLGQAAVKLGVHPRLSAMLLKSSLSTEKTTEKSIAFELAAILSENDIFAQSQSVDIVERLLALQEYKKDKKHALQTWPINAKLIEQVFSTVRSLKASLNDKETVVIFSLADLQCYVGKLLLLAYPDRLAKRRSANCGRYQLANSKGAMLFETDSLFGSDWLVISDCNALKKEGRIFSACAISLDDIYECLGDEIQENDVYKFDEKKQSIVGRRTSSYQSLDIKSQPIAAIPKEAFHKCLSSLLQSEGFKLLNWSAKCESWLSRVEWLGSVIDFPKLSESILLATVDDWLMPYITSISSLDQLKKLNIYPLLKASISWEDQQVLDKEAPTTYLTPSQQTIPIIYHPDQGPMVSVRLQEMFGELETPKIGRGSTPIRFEMLSPAQRAIQTTSDLANFWVTSYFDVAKDMRGKYPRHRWPEKPLLEKPGHSIKHRRSQ